MCGKQYAVSTGVVNVIVQKQPDVSKQAVKLHAIRTMTQEEVMMLVRKCHMQQEAMTSKEAATMVNDDDTMIDNGDDTIEHWIPTVVKTVEAESGEEEPWYT
jgi:hypothetical protein